MWFQSKIIRGIRQDALFVRNTQEPRSEFIVHSVQSVSYTHLPEYLDAIRKRYEELAVTEDGVHAEDLWPEIIKFINYGDYDGAIFGGDMMDYCSNSNIRIIKEGLDQLHIPYMYVRADHDYGAVSYTHLAVQAAVELQASF